MTYGFKNFLQEIIVESLHPELQNIVSSTNSSKRKQTLLTNKIKELTSKGEKTGVEGKMPQGSSRAYLPHEQEHELIIDGKKRKIKTGTKVAIKASLDNHHDKKKYGGSLGNLQNEAEGGDYYKNKRYRILSEDDNKPNHYHTNKDSGIFPPLIDHDYEHHEWSHVGHINNVSKKEFKEITKTKSHPQGISHEDFVDTLVRQHDRDHGKHWKGSDTKEKHLDHIEKHPLTRKFMEYHSEYGDSPHDYRQIKNLGVFNHPNGSKHIVARDHGFNSETERAYREARSHSYKNK